MTRTVVGAYRVVVRLYPKTFREDYGDDLVLLLAEQLRDESTLRVLVRTAVDVGLSLPQRHLESHMHAPRPSILPTVLGATALSALVVGILVGHPGVLAGCALVGAVLGGLAVVAARREGLLAGARPSTSQWWVLLGAGVGLLGSLILVTRATGELPNGGWLLAMVLGLTSLLLIGSGAILGIMRFATRRTRSANAH